MNSPVSIVQAGLERLDQIEPLWKALHQWHTEIGRSLGELRDPERSWQKRRAQYQEYFADSGGLFLIAEVDNRPVGYAMLMHHVGSCAFNTPDLVGEVQTLSILPEYRSQGIGDALMGEALRLFRTKGLSQVSIGVFANNDGAIRFYERYGFSVRYVVMWGDSGKE